MIYISVVAYSVESIIGKQTKSWSSQVKAPKKKKKKASVIYKAPSF